MAMMDFALTILQPDTKSKRPLNLLIMSTKVLILSIELMLMVFVITGNASKTFNAKINECNWLECFGAVPNVEKGRNALNYGLYLINVISESKGQHDKKFDFLILIL